MCDTLVKYHENQLIFGKNSDRSPNEPNLSLFVPAKNHVATPRHCTYIDVEEHPNTFAFWMVRPSWIWGAEMGINEKLVMIGNEAVFTKSKGKKTPRLTGMDLVRLALEEATSAKHACEVILYYLAKYGQGGNCGFDKHFYYDNSFLIADPQEAFILETSGRDYVVSKQLSHANISNRLSLKGNYTLQSQGFRGDFQKKYTEPVFTYFSQAKTRQRLAEKALDSFSETTLEMMMSLLQSHHSQDEACILHKGSVRSLCMHKSLIGDHTTASMIVEYRDNLTSIWITGSSSPCLSLYLPVFLDPSVPPVFLEPEASFQHWLKREYLHRAIYSGWIDLPSYLTKLTHIQASFIHGYRDLLKNNPSLTDLVTYSSQCFQEENRFVLSYQEIIEKVIQNPKLLQPPWANRTIHLGKNGFEVDFARRNAL